MSHKLKKEACVSLGLLCSALVFYLFFAFYDGAVICVDSPSYINMDLSREPLYPAFLALLRLTFRDGGDFYLTAAAFLQSILAAVAAWSLADFLRREFKLTALAGALVLAMPLATSLLCRFAAKRSSMYSNSILTEGIACSLFLIFVRYLLDYCFHQGRKSLLAACMISFLLIATRKQMYLSLILLLIVLVWIMLRTKRWRRGILSMALCAALILAGNAAFDCGYNYVVRGSAGEHSSDNRFLATMVFYTANKEDAEAIADPVVRSLFEQIYDICEENGYVKSAAGQGWYARVTHFGDHYDNIQIDTMWPMIKAYVYENYEGSSMELEERVDALTQEIIDALLPYVWTGIAASFLDNFLSGLVTTVAQRTPVLILYSILIYLAYLLLLFGNIKREGLSRLSVLGIFTLISIAGNVAIVSAVIFCQTRYTIYNMPLFYISGLLLLVNALRQDKILKKGRF